MSKNQRNFFEKLQPWSKIKNDLLSTYLVPYFSKISNTRRKTFYVDCFAGQGRFDDGNDGSPFLAMRIRDEVLRKKLGLHGEIELAFIEKEYGVILNKNLLESFPTHESWSVISGSFESDLATLLQPHHHENLFLYIDPFGIKSLQYSVFQALASCGRFPSVEVLMNFNTFGFIRAARSILSKSDHIPNTWDANGLIERTTAIDELVPFEASLKTIEDLNSVANGNYWIDIVKRNANSPQGFKKAEKEFSTVYRTQLSKLFKYVLKMPIGKKDGSIPEYCMYFMTDHPDGCLLMVDNMMNRSSDLRIEVQHSGQLSLFEQDVENEFVDTEKVQNDFRNFLDRILLSNEGRFVPEVKAQFFAENGVVCKPSALNSVLKDMERTGSITVFRDLVATAGVTNNRQRVSTSFDTKKYRILLFKHR